jgi:hypothetical protein
VYTHVSKCENNKIKEMKKMSNKGPNLHLFPKQWENLSHYNNSRPCAFLW